GHAFLDRLGSAVNEVLGFFQAQTGDFANGLDDADLVGADFSQDDVELGLFFSGGSGATGCGSSDGDGSGSSRHTEFFFHVRDQFGQFEDGQVSDGVQDFCFA